MNNTTNECHDVSADPTYPEHMTSIRILISTVHLLIFAISVVGNGAIVYVTVTTRSLQTIQNCLIANLAAANLCITVLAMPISVVSNMFKIWYFGSILCSVLPYVQAMSVFVTSLSLCVIAVDRYTLIIHPHSNIFNRHNIYIITCVIWLVSMLMPIPYGYVMAITKIDGYCGEFCLENWDGTYGHYKKAFSTMTIIGQYVLPFMIQFYCYACIFFYMGRRAKKRNEERRRRTTFLLVSMVTIFACSQLPFNAYNISFDLFDGFMTRLYKSIIPSLDITYLVMIIAQACAYLNTIANPILYAFLNPQFSSVLKIPYGRGRIPYARRNGIEARQSTVIHLQEQDVML